MSIDGVVLYEDSVCRIERSIDPAGLRLYGSLEIGAHPVLERELGNASARDTISMSTCPISSSSLSAVCVPLWTPRPTSKLTAVVWSCLVQAPPCA